MECIWKINEYSDEAAGALIEGGINPLVALLLSSRGVTEPKMAAELFADDISGLKDPFQLQDMDKAVERIRAAVAKGEHVAVFGDYDVDGITSSTLLGSYLRSLGLECEIYIPDRITEGYGLSCGAVKQLGDRGVTLIITVDCGVTAFEETKYAESLGIDMVITDHHECWDTLPEAVAVVNPKRKDSDYPAGLAGVGVAFKLVCALAGENSINEIVDKYSDLAAIGSIADVMPVTGENRILIKYGLNQAEKHERPGLKSLINEAGLKEKKLNSTNIGFTLAPRMNAAGRMGHAILAAELLLTEDEERADSIAKELCALNKERQQLETKIYNEAVEMLKDFSGDVPIVLASDRWHQGVVGIVASKLAERYNVPAVMICITDDTGKGSCRSVSGFNIFEALKKMPEMLIGFGGHEFAAGLTIKKDMVDEFRHRLGEVYKSTPNTETVKIVYADFPLRDMQLLSMENVQALSSLEPFGTENQQPAICIMDAKLTELTPIGGGKHLRIKIAKNGVEFGCVMFSHRAEEFGTVTGDRVDIIFCPQINEFRGIKNVQLLVTNMRKSNVGDVCRHFFEGDRIARLEAERLLPIRADLTKVWRAVTAGECEYKKYDREYICLRVFEELGIMKLTEKKNRITAVPDGEGKKVDLGASKILKSLEDIIHGVDISGNYNR